ncbi:MAG: penicillin-binding protein 2 [Treponemataceae bacterium]
MRLTDLKNRPGSSVSKTEKIFVLIVIFSAWILFYTFKLFSMQVVEGEEYHSRSVSIAQRSKPIPPQRGEIYERTFTNPLAVNIDSFAIDLIPGEIPSGRYDTVALRLANFLGIKKEEIDRKIPVGMRRSFSTIEIRSNIPFETITKIAENTFDLPGVSWRSKPVRNYLGTGSISHILGYIGDITRDEIKVLYNKGYNPKSIVGKTGIERQYDQVLQGVAGSESRVVDVHGRFMREPPIIKTPVMGKTLVLTIDTRIQELAEKALGNRIGAAVVLKPTTGEILAMVSYPFYDLNLFSSDDSSNAYQQLITDPNKPLLNRAVNVSYPPASTFKVVSAVAVLTENTFSADKKVECAGVLEYGDRRFRCHIGPGGHGYLDLRNGLAQSCNVYFWTVGRDSLGIERLTSYAREFGFGSSLQIDLPSQSNGFVPTAQWKERRFHEKWLGGDTMNMSVGQGFTLVTPLHIANMMAMVVNEGTIYKPHILKDIRNPATGDIISTFTPEPLHTSNIPSSVWKEAKNDLRYTVSNGSAQNPLRNKNVQIAGKTGTAEVSGFNRQWHSWFVAYAPFDAPVEETVVVSVLVEAVNTWEWWAPYCSNIILQGIFQNQTFEESVAELGFNRLARPVGRQE